MTATALCCMPVNRVNQAKTALVFFHWFSFSLLTSVVLMWSRSCLLIFPISDLAGLIRRQVGLLADSRLVVFESNKGFTFGSDVYLT